MGIFVIVSYWSQELGSWIFSKKTSRGFVKVSDRQWGKDLSSAVEDYEKIISFYVENNNEIPLPKRATRHSAGYDIFSPFGFVLNPGEEIKIPTGFKAYMGTNEKLVFHTRSGNGFKYIRLANGTGIGDSDYFNCEGNEGHYWVKLRNEGKKVFHVKMGDAIAQCIFENFLVADNDYLDDKTIRTGGFGSTSSK